MEKESYKAQFSTLVEEKQAVDDDQKRLLTQKNDIQRQIEEYDETRQAATVCLFSTISVFTLLIPNCFGIDQSRKRGTSTPQGPKRCQALGEEVGGGAGCRGCCRRCRQSPSGRVCRTPSLAYFVIL